jgi:hypothetical protein
MSQMVREHCIKRDFTFCTLLRVMLVIKSWKTKMVRRERPEIGVILLLENPKGRGHF